MKAEEECAREEKRVGKRIAIEATAAAAVAAAGAGASARAPWKLEGHLRRCGSPARRRDPPSSRRLLP